jgi:hypothetical protein
MGMKNPVAVTPSASTPAPLAFRVPPLPTEIDPFFPFVPTLPITLFSILTIERAFLIVEFQFTPPFPSPNAVCTERTPDPDPEPPLPLLRCPGRDFIVDPPLAVVLALHALGGLSLALCLLWLGPIGITSIASSISSESLSL